MNSNKKWKAFTLIVMLITTIIIIYKKNTYKNKHVTSDFNLITLVDDNVKYTVDLRVVEFSDLRLDKWQWPKNNIEQPSWFKAFQAMTDPRKFNSFQEYVTHTTPNWRALSHTNIAAEFDSWKSNAIENSELHDKKVIEILRSVEIKYKNEHYIFVAISKGAVSPITKKYETSQSMATIVFSNGDYQCANLSSDCLLVINPESKDKLDKIIKTKIATVNNKMLDPYE